MHIALITEVDQGKLDRRIQPIEQECKCAVSHYLTPRHFVETHGGNPAPDLVVSAVNFKTSGLQEWQNIVFLLGHRLETESLEKTQILTYAHCNYHLGEIPPACQIAMKAGILGHVHMDQWIGSERNPDCFRTEVVPHIKQILEEMRAGTKADMPRDPMTLLDVSSSQALIGSWLAQTGRSKFGL